MVDVSEKNFEAQIEHVLRNVNRYESRTTDDYNAALCLIPDDVIRFVQATQPDAWAQVSGIHKDDTRSLFLNRLAEQIDKRGTLEVLRRGFKFSGAAFRLVYFRPSSGLNADTQQRYAANVFSVVRQLYFSTKTRQSLDMALFINGLPVFTAELKNPFTGQTVKNAMRQYRKDRDPNEPLFKFGRCLIHFAVDPDLVYMTSQLAGDNTFFLPFNQGKHGGAGNPPRHDNFATAYLWEQVWTKDSVLNLIDQFIHMVEVDGPGRKRTQRLIVPRYHQLDAVRRLIADAREKGTGQRYLIQHSAGSGKSYSIAWLAHQLASLHNAADQRVFDSVVVITDRRVLDRQLQAVMRQFEQVQGLVENIDTTSRQLRQALEDGKQIIVTTLQKFPVIVDEISRLAGKRFAVIVDEAHSSQSGESVKSLKAVLTAEDLDAAESEEGQPEPPDYEDLIVAEIRRRKHQPNISTFAFTATPKPKTLELFGTPRPDGRREAFSLYSMRQAIDEGFILDVLANYTTYRAYWRLLKTVADDPQYESRKAKALLRRFVDLHRHTINQKVEIITGHFQEHVSHRIGGRAKAMIVTRSRLHAVRYVQALRHHLKESGLPYQALVAFSGTVQVGGDFTEAGMNGFPEVQTAEAFNDDAYRFLVVANKFQTGFDQPLLYAMYVDKLLSGVHAVQTLSRLNRTHPGKDGTFVLDFANEAEHIQASFAPYYERTLLSETTDPNLLYDRETDLRNFDLYTEDEVDAFAKLYFTPGTTQDRLHAPLNRVVSRYEELNPDAQADFRSKLMDYVRQYAFLSQILPFEDRSLEKLYVFAKFLRRKLPVDRLELPTEVLESIDIESYRLRRTTDAQDIAPQNGDPNLDPMLAEAGGLLSDDLHEPLSAIIQDLNDRFGVELTEADRVTIQYLESQLAENATISDSIRINPLDKVRMTFDAVTRDAIEDVYKSNFTFYRLVNDNEPFRNALFAWLFERYVAGQGD